MKTKLMLSTLIAAMAISGTAFASGGCGEGKFMGVADPARAARHFASFDTNGDGLVSREEAQQKSPRLYVMFDAVDNSKDGQVSLDEWTSFHQRMQEAWSQDKSIMQDRMKTKMEARFKAADKDGDGFLSKAEAEAAMPRLAKSFAAVDTDNDGKISPADVVAFRKKMMESHGDKMAGMKSGMGGGMHW